MQNWTAMKMQKSAVRRADVKTQNVTRTYRKRRENVARRAKTPLRRILPAELFTRSPFPINFWLLSR